jgi:nickel-dependent lactate racemase
LKESKSPQGVLEKISQPGFNKQDQWQVQIQAQIQLKADVFVYSEGLTGTQISDAQLIPIHSIEETLSRLVKKIGPSARICAIPEGPLVIPYLADLNQRIV